MAKKKAGEGGTTPSGIPVPNTADTAYFIKRIHGAESAWYQTYSKAKELSINSESFRSLRNLSLRDRLLKANSEGLNVAMAVNKIKGPKRSAKYVTAVRAVFVDSDSDSLTVANLTSLAVVPHIVVESSEGKLHAYWLVEDCDVNRFKAVQLALAKKFGTDPSVSDAARVMRLPGSINWKYEPPFLARIVHSNEAKPVNVRLLAKKLKLKLAKASSANTSCEVMASVEQAVALPEQKVAEIRSALAKIPADDRTLWLHCGMAIHSVAPTPQGYELWKEWSETSKMKFDADDQEKTWTQMRQAIGGISLPTLFWYAAQATAEVEFDQMKMASLFAATYHDQLRYDPSMKSWYGFNGVVWTDEQLRPMQLAKSLVNDLSKGDEKKRSLMRHYRTVAGLSSIIKMAELEESLRIVDEAFDADANLLAVKNGVIDLPSGILRPAVATDFLRRHADVEFHADAKCPLWDKFIKEVTMDDVGLAKFLQCQVGYTVFGHAKAQVYFVIEGPGRNGKGVFLRTLRDLLGNYAKDLPPNIMTGAYSSNANSASPALMMLKSIRMGIVTELPSKRGFDTAFVKQFSGGDSITARPNYGANITFKPEGKLWITTNDMPEMSANDEAMWRRTIAIPFLAKISAKARNDGLEEELKSEYPGILNWILKGARDYIACNGNVRSAAVDAHKKLLRRQADTVGGWLKENCRPNPDAKLRSSDGYKDYCAYAKLLGKAPVTHGIFGTRMVAAGYPRKDTNRANCFLGVQLKASKH